MRSARAFTSLTFTRHLQSPTEKSVRRGNEPLAVGGGGGQGGELAEAVGCAPLSPEAIEELGQGVARELARRPHGAGDDRPGEGGVAAAHPVLTSGQADQGGGVVGQR